jgi:hypothetical protein
LLRRNFLRNVGGAALAMPLLSSLGCSEQSTREAEDLGQAKLAENGFPTEARVTGWHLAGLFAFFLKSFTLCLGLVFSGLVAVKWFLGLPSVFHRAMMLYVTFLPLLGVAAVSRKLALSTVDRTLIIGFCVGAVAVQLLHIPVLAAILIAAAGGWLGERFDGR